MRSLLLSGLLVLISLAGCKKSSQGLESATIISQLPGDWKLQLYVVGIGQVVQTTPDSVVILSLGADDHYTRKKNGKVYETGTYSVANIKVAYGNQLVPGISFSATASANGMGTLINLKQDTLTLIQNVQMEGGFLEYTRAR